MQKNAKAAGDRPAAFAFERGEEKMKKRKNETFIPLFYSLFIKKKSE